MKNISNDYKNEICKFGRQIDSKITYELDGETIELGKSELNSVSPLYEGSILKSVMKQLDIESSVDIPLNTILNYQFGLFVNNQYEYINLGNYIVKSSEKQEDKRSYKITCYDKILYSMEDYVNLGITYPITIRDYINTICTHLGLTFANISDTFPNYDKEITKELYLDENGGSLNYTFRDVLDELAQATASTICINNDDELELRYINKEETTFEIEGNTIQNGTPSPDNPAPIISKTGIITEIINGREYTFNLGNIVLRKIGTYKDKILKINGVWSIKRQIGSVILDGTENWTINKSGTENWYYRLNNKYYGLVDLNVAGICNYFPCTNIANNNTNQGISASAEYHYILLRYGNEDTIENWKTWLSNHNTIIDYPLATETIETITDTNLIQQLNDASLGIDTIDAKYLKDINVNFGEKFGPVNTIVLARAGGSDRIYKSYPEDLPEEDKIALVIEENQIMNFNDRDTYLPDILNELKGLEYYINDFSSTGITYYELCDLYNIEIDNTTYKCLMLNDEINITQGLEELIHTEKLGEDDTDYKKADKTDRKVNQTYIIADKQKGQIEALVSKTEEIENETNLTKETLNQLIIDTEGMTNTFRTTGGNNIFRNTGLWFENKTNEELLFPANDLYPSDDLFIEQKSSYEYWSGDVIRLKEERAVNSNALLLQNGTLYQEQEVPNGIYTVSFKYQKLLELGNTKVKINDKETLLTSSDATEYQEVIEVNSRHINVQFITDINNSCEIYDLMVNTGDTKAPYSQNQNETTTDTVNISKGITITSTDVDTTFKADADGTRIFNNNDLDDPIAKFTDTGIETNYINVKDTAEIVEMLVKKVGNHTWLRKL